MFNPNAGIRLDASKSQHLWVTNFVDDFGMTDAVTFSAKVMFNSLPTTGNTMTLASKFDTGDDNRQWSFHLYNSSGTYQLHYYFDTDDGTGTTIYSGYATWTPVVDQWYDIFISVNTNPTGKITVRIDNEAASVSAVNANSGAIYQGPARALIGANENSGVAENFFDGIIADVFIGDEYQDSMGDRHITIPFEQDGVPFAGLVDWWKMGESTSVQSIAGTGGNNSAILLPMPSADIEKGDTEYITCGNNASLQLTGNVSMGCWIKPETIPSSGAHHILGKVAASDVAWELFFYQGGLLYARWSYDGSLSNYIGGYCTHGISAGSWANILASADPVAGTMKIFIDGSEASVTSVSTGSGSSWNNSAQAFEIGAIQGGSNHYDGLVAQVRLYDYYFPDAAEVQVEMVARNSIHSNLVEEWLLESDFAATINSDNDGTAASGTIPFVGERPVVVNTPPWYNGSTDFEKATPEYAGTLVNYSTHPLAFTGAFSFGCWIKFESVGTQQYLGGRWGGGANNRALGILLQNDGTSTNKFEVIIDRYGTSTTRGWWTNTSVTVEADKWYHILIAVNPGATATCKMWVNGVESTMTVRDLDANVTSLFWAAGQKFVLGSLYGTSAYTTASFDGRMSHARLYGSYITDITEVETEMWAKRSTHADLIEEWDMGDPTFVQGADFELGDTEYLDCTNNSALRGTNLPQGSICCWIKPESLPAATITLACRWGNGASFKEYLFRILSTGALSVIINDGTSTWDGTNYYAVNESTASLVAGEWAHVACSWDVVTRTGHLYINGVEVAATTNTNGTGQGAIYDSAGNVSFTIGSYDANLNYYDGIMRNLRIFDSELNATEIAAEMRSLYTQHADIVEEWKLHRRDNSNNYPATYLAARDGVSTSGTVALSTKNQDHIRAIVNPIECDLDEVLVQSMGQGEMMSLDQGVYALEFENSVENVVNYGDQSAFDGLTAFTIEALIYPTSNQPDGLGVLLGKVKNNLNCFYTGLISGSSYPKLRVIVWSHFGNNNNYCYFQTDSDCVTLNEWHHLMFAMDLSTESGYLFVDGVLIDSTKAESDDGCPPALLNTTADIRVGEGMRSTDPTDYHLDAKVSYIAGWDSVKETEDFDPRASAPDRTESGLVWLSKFDEGTSAISYEQVNMIEGAVGNHEPDDWVFGSSYPQPTPVAPIFIRRKMCNLICG